MKNLIEIMNWRYATKRFNPEKKIDKETMDMLLETLRLSPSSYGLQPWKFIIVRNKEIRERLKIEAGYNQPQMTDSSDMIVFASKKNITNDLVDEYIKFVSKENDIDISKLDGLSTMVKGSLIGKSDEQKRAWAAHQLYLAVGVLLTSCAVSSVDACPMEGFDALKVDEILNLSVMGLESKAIVTMGYRSEDDKHALDKKIRFPKEDVFIELN